MKRFMNLLAVFVGILLFVSFSSSTISISAENSKIDSLKQQITELEKRIKDLEGLLKIYHSPETHEPGDNQGWWNKKNWRNLKKGMTKEEVLTILGEPVKAIKGFRTIWYYPNFYRGYVSFDEDGNLSGWIEP